MLNLTCLFCKPYFYVMINIIKGSIDQSERRTWMKEKIKEFVLGLGVDDVGIAAVKDYKSPRSPDLQSIFPGAKSLVVLAYKELSNCESENMQIAMGGRLDGLEFARSSNYRVARFLEREFKAKAMTVPPSYPLYMSYETKGTLGDVSLRHAAVAAGLGNFGRHNLVIHPKMGIEGSLYSSDHEPGVIFRFSCYREALYGL